MNTKRWYRSRTLIFNAMVAVFAALADITGLLQPVVSPRAFVATVVVVTVINAVLRAATRQPISRKEP